MTAHFEVVRTDAAQPWHARMVINGRITWRVENLTRQIGAERAIESLLREVAGGTWGLMWNVEGVEKTAIDDVGNVHDLNVKYVDERPEPPAPLAAAPPYYVKEVHLIVGAEDFWHDRDYHYRNCYGDECTEGTPSKGAEIHVRGGSVVAS